MGCILSGGDGDGGGRGGNAALLAFNDTTYTEEQVGLPGARVQTTMQWHCQWHHHDDTLLTAHWPVASLKGRLKGERHTFPAPV